MGFQWTSCWLLVLEQVVVILLCALREESAMKSPELENTTIIKSNARPAPTLIALNINNPGWGIFVSWLGSRARVLGCGNLISVLRFSFFILSKTDFLCSFELITERRSQGWTGYEHWSGVAEGIHGQGCRCINIGRWHTDQSPGSRPELRKFSKVAFLERQTPNRVMRPEDVFSS